MPTAPYVVAAATDTLESVSNTPTPTSIGSIARGGLSAVEVISAATITTGTDAERAAVTAHAALSSEPASMPTKNNPKPSAATTARPAPAAITRCPPARGSRDRTAMPMSTSATPSHCSAPGTSPRDASTASGTIGAAAEIGATIPIAPIAKPR